MLRAVLDANVSSSAIIHPAGTPGRLIERFLRDANFEIGANQVFSYAVMPDNALPDGTTLRAGAEVVAGIRSLVRAQAATDVAAAPAITLVVTPVGAVGSATFTATITNVSAADLANIALNVLTLNDAQVLLASSTPTPSCTNNAFACGPGGVVSWPAFSLVTGGSQSFIWVSQILAGTPRGTVVRTTTRVTAGISSAAFRGRDVVVN